MAQVTIIGLKEFERAIKRNPQKVAVEGKNLIVRAFFKANQLLNRPPWRVGDKGGRGKGIPKKTGNLKEGHTKDINGLKGRIYVREGVKYAKYVHGRGYGEKNKRTGVTSRPWFDNTAKDLKPEIQKLGKDFLKTIVKDLAK